MSADALLSALSGIPVPVHVDLFPQSREQVLAISAALGDIPLRWRKRTAKPGDGLYMAVGEMPSSPRRRVTIFAKPEHIAATPAQVHVCDWEPVGEIAALLEGSAA